VDNNVVRYVYDMVCYFRTASIGAHTGLRVQPLTTFDRLLISTDARVLRVHNYFGIVLISTNACARLAESSLRSRRSSGRVRSKTGFTVCGLFSSVYLCPARPWWCPTAFITSIFGRTFYDGTHVPPRWRERRPMFFCVYVNSEWERMCTNIDNATVTRSIFFFRPSFIKRKTTSTGKTWKKTLLIFNRRRRINVKNS
jgi:hypothetical protein